MISRDTIRIAEARTASHAAVFQIRAAAYDAIPADRPIARAIAAAELRRERAALAWSAERLATVRKYAAYEGIEGEDRPTIAPWQPDPIALDMPETPAVQLGSIDPRSFECPRCHAQPGERCHKDGRPQTRNHDARTRAALLGTQPAVASLDRAIRSGETRRRLPGRADTSRSGRMMIAREDAKHTNPADRSPAQDALIQMKPAYGAFLTEGYNLRQAETAGDAETIDACRRLYREAEARYNDLSAIANAAI